MKMQRRLSTYLLVACSFGLPFVASSMPASAAKGDLQIYFIDVEGGQVDTVRDTRRPIAAD